MLISAPAGEMKTIVYNVNDDTIDASDTIISVASCTTNCLAPLAKALHDAFEIKVGTMTTIHAYTGTQALVDGPRGKDLRASRAAAENIIPHTTGAAKAIGLVIPALSGKLKGHAQRVPVKTGSVTELVSILGKKVTVEEINAALKKATGCKVYMDPVDAQGSQLLPLTPDVLTDNWPANDELTIDELTFKIYHTPGHTRGGVCLSCYGLLFSGDTLFAGSCGRTDFPGGSMQEMAKSLSLLAELPLPDATKVLPGHEGFSTLGQERSTNPYMNGAWY